MSKVVCGSEGCIGWMTNIVVTGGERYKSDSTTGDVRVKLELFAVSNKGPFNR